MRRSVGRQTLGLLGWLLLSFAAAGVGGIASRDAQEFYRLLLLPEWAPPAWLFGPVWSALYLLIGLAGWLVWRDGGFRRSPSALVLFLLQLVANALWSWLFFVWRLGALAFLDSLLLWFLIAATIVAFRRIRPPAGLMLLPYLGWVGFATALTYTIWRLNPGLLG